MGKTTVTRLGTIKIWGRYVLKELASVERLLEEGIAPANRHHAREEVLTLLAPHLAILVHKRLKICGPDNAGSNDQSQWNAELSRYADRWPHLAANAAERRKLVAEMERIVVAEQNRLLEATLSSAVPVTSRFDTSWAT